MDAEGEQEDISVVVNVGDPEIKVDFLEGEEVMGEEARFFEILNSMELDVARASEKLLNLTILMMRVATREFEFDALALDAKDILPEDLEKALEFEFLSVILDSEVAKVNEFIAALQADVISIREAISSYQQLGNSLNMERQISDLECALKQSLEQISEIRIQSAQFQKTLSRFGGDQTCAGGVDTKFSEDSQFLDINKKIQMQTAEQQRNILRMLEKSLAREMDLEKKLIESRQSEEELNMRLLSSEEDVFYLQEETTDSMERCFEAEIASEVLTGIAKELLGQLHIVQFNLNGSMQRETALRAKLDGSMQQLENKEIVLQKLESSNLKLNDFLLAQTDSLKTRLTEAEDNLILANSENFTLKDRVSALENQLKEAGFQSSRDVSPDKQHSISSEMCELEHIIEDLKDKLSGAESMNERAESKCKLLTDINMERNEELGLLKDKVDSLERQLTESDIERQRAIAGFEAIEEQQSLLLSSIRDMESVIEDLKLKVAGADSRADNAEEQLITVSETNAGLNEELSFLRDRIEFLETSLHQAEETKMATAKDIDVRAKVITNLLMQLAIERERLHQQIASLAMQNKVLIIQLQQTKKDPSIIASCDNRSEKQSFSKNDFTNAPHSTEIKEEVTVLSAKVTEEDRNQKNVYIDTSDAETVDLASEFGTVRRIDAGLLNWKHMSVAIPIVLISAAAYFFRKHNPPF